MITLRPIKQEDVEPLRAAAEADGHAVLAPTFVMEKEGKIVGYVAVQLPPLMIWWASKTDTNARDSKQALCALENSLRLCGQTGVAICVSKDSPYQHYMERFGFFRVQDNVDMFMKQL